MTNTAIYGNIYQYIIECIKADPGNGDIIASETNKKNLKLAGEFLYKLGGRKCQISLLMGKNMIR